VSARTLDSARARGRRQAQEQLRSLERERAELLRLFPDLESGSRNPTGVPEHANSWTGLRAVGRGEPRRSVDEVN
jgi:hypothetical protein